MANQIPLARYLFCRLHQLGARSIHGVPSDYNLRALDYITPAGLHWVGNANELNAGYAADGYARVKGISALITGFGVGELSAINAIGGAYSEMAPVVHIVGTPPRAAQTAGLCVHHTLGDGNYRVFAEMYSKLTVAQANLNNPATASAMIDRTLRECILQSRPVYIELPTDMVTVQIPEADLRHPIDLSVPANDQDLEDCVVKKVLDKIYEARQPFIIVDGFAASYGYYDEANELVHATGFPTSTTSMGKGIIPETAPNFYGVYTGASGHPDFMSWVQSCDLVVRLGPLDADTNTSGFTTIPDPRITINIHGNTIEIGAADSGIQTYTLHAKAVLRKLLDQLDQSKLPQYVAYPSQVNPRKERNNLPLPKTDSLIFQETFWKRISSFFQPGDIILTETGTAAYGGSEFVLPPDTTMIVSSIWLSIGYMLGACAGASLALRDMVTDNVRSNGRTILFEGDGSMQMTAQAISDMIKNRLDVIIFLINNDGYTIERLIHGMAESYNDVQPWRYLEAPSYFGAPKNDSEYPVTTHRASTWGELSQIIDGVDFQHPKGFKMVEIIMKREDGPDTLKKLAAYMDKRNSAVSLNETPNLL
ncbi:pyruvate decarboxylase [Bisporella sp. PMI_857]|nr:pyruvate decarboxylase [Bisporella sp. PMI_857]